MADTEATELAHVPPLRLGTAIVEPARGIVRAVDGREVTLQPQVMRVLLTLVAAETKTLSRDDLHRRCWAGRTVGDDAIDRTIARIRRVDAELDAGLGLETIPKVGYRLTAAGEWIGRSPGSDEPEDSSSAVSPPGASSRRSVLALGAGAVAVAAGALSWRWLGTSGAARDQLKIGVQPFRARPGDPTSAAMADALSREARTSLARIDGTAIIAASDTSAMAGADLLVDATVDRVGDQMRVAASLQGVRAEPSRTDFARTAPATDRFAFQDAIVGELIQDVAGQIAPERVRERLPGYPRDAVVVRRVIEAERLMEQARQLQMDGNPDAAFDAGDAAALRIAAAQAIDPRDPGALVAFAALTKNSWTRALAALPLTATQRLDAARVPLRQAMRADPNYPAALAALGDIRRRYEWRWGEAENLLRRALAKQPDLVEGRWTYAYMLGTQGRAVEGLEQARTLVRLASGTAWRRVALPRLLYLAGQRAECFRHYERELRLAPANAFVVREIYFIHLSEADARALVILADRLDGSWRGAAMPKPIERLAQRARAAAQALRGAPDELRALLVADIAAYDAPRTGPSATQQGRASTDLLFVFAMELAHAGLPSRALEMLDRALLARSLYWPACLPYGPAEFPDPVRRDPRYAALWRRDERLAELIDRRRRAILEGQMIGVRPDGRRITAL